MKLWRGRANMDDAKNNFSGSWFRLLFLEIVPKISLSFVALSYIFGFIIVNTHLGNFGIFSTTVLKAKYIASGAVFLVFALLAGMTIYPFLLFVSGRQPSLKWEGLYSLGSLFFMAFLLQHIAPEAVSPRSLNLSSIYFKIALGLWIICGILMVMSTSLLSNKISKLKAPLYFVFMGAAAYQTIKPDIFWIFFWISVLGVWAFAFIARILKVATKQMKVSADMAIAAIWLLSALLALCKSYSDYLYPKITSQYGGGKPVSVTLLLTRGDDSGLGSLFHDNQTSSERMQDVTLLDEDADYFFIQRQTGQEIETIRIRKPLVNAVISLKK
jgi:hypothetical protein